MTAAAINPVPFKNDLDQTINPGDEVVIVTTGYSHSVSTNKAVYLGMHPNGGVSCEKQVKQSWHVFKGTEEKVPWSWWSEVNATQTKWANEWRAANPGQYNYYQQPEYQAIREAAMQKIEVASAIRPVRTTLKLNRMFKLAA